jgi:hypothetical protein
MQFLVLEKEFKVHKIFSSAAIFLKTKKLRRVMTVLITQIVSNMK